MDETSGEALDAAGVTGPHNRQVPTSDGVQPADAGEAPAVIADFSTPFHVGPVLIPNRVVLAPMAGLTTSAYRRHLKQHGAGLVTTEMVSAYGLLHGNRRTDDYLRFDRGGTAHRRPAFRRHSRRDGPCRSARPAPGTRPGARPFPTCSISIWAARCERSCERAPARPCWPIPTARWRWRRRW